MNAHTLDLLLIHAKELGEVVLFVPPNGWGLVPEPKAGEPIKAHELGDDELDPEVHVGGIVERVRP